MGSFHWCKSPWEECEDSVNICYCYQDATGAHLIHVSYLEFLNLRLELTVNALGKPMYKACSWTWSKRPRPRRTISASSDKELSMHGTIQLLQKLFGTQGRSNWSLQEWLPMSAWFPRHFLCREKASISRYDFSDAILETCVDWESVCLMPVEVQRLWQSRYLGSDSAKPEFQWPRLTPLWRSWSRYGCIKHF